MAQQTAVEWLENELFKAGSGTPAAYSLLFQQAKAMEKEQIKDAFKVGYNNGYVDGECLHIPDSNNAFNEYIYLNYEKDI